MMVIERLKLFRAVFAVSVAVAAAVFAAGCSSGPKPMPEPAVNDVLESLAVPAMRAELSAKEVLQGSVILITVRVPTDTKLSDFSAIFDETDLPLYSLTKGVSKNDLIFQGIIGILASYRVGPASIKLSYQGKAIELPFTVLDAKYPSEVLKVDPKHVRPSAKDAARIKKEAAEVGRLYTHLTKDKLWAGPFLFPINSEKTSRFGTKRVYNGELQSYHSGLDLKAQVGTPVNAAASGVVVLAKELFLTGNTILINHGYGLFSLYAHLSKLDVKPSQKLRAGARLGLSGQTGRVSGPHLHWAIIIHRTKVDPLELMRLLID